MPATFGFLLFHEVEELDFVGPWEVISVWRKNFEGPDKMVTISQDGGIVTCAKGLQIISSHSFSDYPRLDYLVVPGGWGTRAEVHNEKLISFIKEATKNCKGVLSVCTGAFLLQAAGLLDGKRATTHWRSLDRLRAFDKTTVVEERIVRDGNIWSCAGISSGIDLALAFLSEVAGEEVAGQVQFQMEYYPSKRYGNLHNSKDAPKYLKSDHEQGRGNVCSFFPRKNEESHVEDSKPEKEPLATATSHK